MPPRYSKTELGVIMFIAWCLTKNPAARFMHLSYSDNLSLGNSRKIKDIIQNDVHQKIWGLKLRTDSTAKKEWYTEQGGGVYATSIYGQVVGFGAGILRTKERREDSFDGCIVIDDANKIKDASSEVMRSTCNDTFDNSVVNRKNTPDTPIINIQQRAHENDLSGHILDGGTTLDFKHVVYAIIHNDKPLWEWKDNMEAIQKRKHHPKTAHIFECQDMQNPQESKDLVFPRTSLNRFSESDIKKMAFDSRFGAIDVADQGNDSLSFPQAKGNGRFFYLTDVLFTKDGAEFTIPECRRQTIANSINRIIVETNNQGKIFYDNLSRQFQGTAVRMHGKYNTDHKHTRIIMQAAFIKKYFLFRNDYEQGSDYDKFMKELTGYSKEGKGHDDAPDSLCLLSAFIQSQLSHLFL